ncbi:MAG: DoxX family protein [Polyangiales bacterium]
MDSLVCLQPPCVAGALTSLDIVRLAVAALLAILFLQSGIDKIVDRKGNVEWLTGHFSKSPLAGQVVPMLSVITLIEVSAGALSAIGVPVLLFTSNRLPAFLGALLAVLALLMLFFGQRVAKDYAGAAALVPYFSLSCAGLALLGI